MMKIEENHKEFASVGIYLHGTNLNPSEITSLLNVAPTSAWKSGDIHVTSSGTKICRKSGMWSLSIRKSFRPVEQVILKVINPFISNQKSFEQLKNVESGELSIYCSMIGVPEDNSSFSFNITQDTLEKIRLSGLSLSIEFCLTSD